MLAEQQEKLSAEGQQQFCRRYLPCLFEVVRTLAPRYSRHRVQSVLPKDFNGLVEDLLHETSGGRFDNRFDIPDRRAHAFKPLVGSDAQRGEETRAGILPRGDMGAVDLAIERACDFWNLRHNRL